eukprot:m.385698 g.385698  ORF g.385698 m.385698 type:complete len:324 (-) comp21011_c0_seq1:445-1416(-)
MTDMSCSEVTDVDGYIHVCSVASADSTMPDSTHKNSQEYEMKLESKEFHSEVSPRASNQPRGVNNFQTKAQESQSIPSQYRQYSIIKSLESVAFPPPVPAPVEVSASWARTNTVALRWMLHSLVSIFVVFYWRGTWVMMDVYLYPNDDTVERSAWCSVAIGYGGFLLLAFPDFLRAYLSSNATQEIVDESISNIVVASLHPSTMENNHEPHLITPARSGGTNSLCVRGIQSFILQSIYTYLLGFIAVNAWRGIWLLLDLHFLPDDLKASAWGCHAISVAVLLACSHLQSVFAPPVVVLSDSNDDTTVRLANTIQPIRLWGAKI